MQQRLSSAKKEQFRVGENGSKNGKSLDALPATAAELRALGVEYKERGMLDASLAVLSAALSAAEAAGPVNGRSQLVDPLSALADLHLTIRGDGYDVAAFLAAIKKWQLVVVEKDPGRSLAAQQSLVIDQRYNMK